MQNIQDVILDRIDGIAKTHKLTPMIRFNYANTGHVFAKDATSLKTAWTMSFQFDRKSVALKLSGPAVAAQGYTDEPPDYRVPKPSDGTVEFFALDYDDDERLELLLTIINDISMAGIEAVTV